MTPPRTFALPCHLYVNIGEDADIPTPDHGRLMLAKNGCPDLPEPAGTVVAEAVGVGSRSVGLGTFEYYSAFGMEFKMGEVHNEMK